MPQSNPTELTDLEVDRVDAVDRPATRRKFLIVKAEGDAPAGDPVAEAKRLIAAAGAAVKRIHASKAEYDDLEMVDALNELAQASGAVERFTKSVAAPAEGAAAAATTPPPAAAAAVAAPATVAAAAPAVPAIPGIDVAALGASIGEAVVKALKADIDQVERLDVPTDPGRFDTPAVPPPSAQPEPVAVAKRSGGPKLGEGMFANIVGH